MIAARRPAQFADIARRIEAVRLGPVRAPVRRTPDAADTRGIWRSTDWGTNWTQAHRFNTARNVGELCWAPGSDHLVYAAGGSSLAISKDAGATFQDVV